MRAMHFPLRRGQDAVHAHVQGPFVACVQPAQHGDRDARSLEFDELRQVEAQRFGRCRQRGRKQKTDRQAQHFRSSMAFAHAP
jgi:hypothetical protein